MNVTIVGRGVARGLCAGLAILMALARTLPAEDAARAANSSLATSFEPFIPVELAESPGLRERVAAQLQRSRDKYKTVEAWAARRKEIREAFFKGAALWPLPKKTALRPIIRDHREHDGYSVENVALETFPGFFCTGNLYRPLRQTAPGPGVLCPHGHFVPLGRMRPDQQIRCAQLARMGATVFSYSMVGWQDSKQTTHDDPLVLALQTWNSIRALDYLCSLPEVDTNRLAITGASGGGTQTLYLSMLDDRIRVSAPVVIVYPWMAPAGCKCEGGMPVMQASDTDVIEMAASVAPRPKLIMTVGGADPSHDFPQVGFPFIRDVYGIYGKSNLVANAHFADELHDYGPSKRKAMYAFFAKHLGLPVLDEDLSRITIEPPEKLAVFDSQHPLPAGALIGSNQVDRAFYALPRPAANAGAPAARSDEALLFTPPGFAREGLAARAAGADCGHIRIKVRDAATGQLAPCRLNVIGPDGNYYQPETNNLSPYGITAEWPKPGAWGNRPGKGPFRYIGRFFYTVGEAEVAVPAGQCRVEAAKGFQFTPLAQTVEVAAGQTKDIDLVLTPAADVSQFGYFCGDPHFHFPRRTGQDDNAILDILSAEDLHFGHLLAYNEPMGPYTAAMEKLDSPQFFGLGETSLRERNGCAIMSGQEYRSTTYGHLVIGLHDALMYPGKTLNADDWPVFGQVAREVRKTGGVAFQAHGGYSQEIYADAALGAVDAVELLQFGIYRGLGLEGWYDMLNAGYRFPITAASDWPACRFLGDSRTFVHEPGGPSFPDWLHGAAEGRSFVSSGPLLLLEVDDQGPGARIDKTGPGSHAVTVRIRMRCEVAPVKNVGLIVNGEPVQTWAVPAAQQQGHWWEIKTRLELHESSWIAARAHSATPSGQSVVEAHTNPVYVYLNGRAPYRAAALDAWLARIDGQLAVHRQRQFPEKAQVLHYFEEARDTLLRIREQGGLGENETAGMVNARKIAPVKSPAESMKTIETIPGFHLELVAAEPLVRSPTAATFDENGNLYVCEMTDDPNRRIEGEPSGSVRLLRDARGSGRFDQSTVFVDHLPWATGIAPWKGGVLIAAPPDLWFCKDTNGDGVADIHFKLFSWLGVASRRQMFDNLEWGLDHKLYGSSLGASQALRQAGWPFAHRVTAGGNDFCFDPMSRQFDAIFGVIQFGNAFDDWGNHFLAAQPDPLLQIVLPRRYLARNPLLAAPSEICAVAPGPVPVFPLTLPADPTGASGPNLMASGVTIYRGGAYPPQYYGTAFMPDPKHHLIHHRLLVPAGSGFQSVRAEPDTEFLRSSDPSFCPVNLVNAPDGTLYCLDMERAGFSPDAGRGRIYRIAPAGFHAPSPPRLGRKTGRELIATLENKNVWCRETASRLINERQDKSLRTPLQRMAAQSKLPQARAAALWSLQGLESLNDATLLAGLADASAGVRQNAVRLAEPRLAQSPKLFAKAVALASDTNPAVRLQLAFSLGEVHQPGAIEALAALALQGESDYWLDTAILSSVAEAPGKLFEMLLADQPATLSGRRVDFYERVAELTGRHNVPAELKEVLTALTTVPALQETGSIRTRLLLALGRGQKQAGSGLSGLDLYGPTVAQVLDEFRMSAQRIALDPHSPETARVGAVEKLSYLTLERVHFPLSQCLETGQPAAVQIAAVKALGDFTDPLATTLLLRYWPHFSSAVRHEAFQAMLKNEERTLAWLQAVRQGKISLGRTDRAQRELLLRHRNPAVAALARQVFDSKGERPD